jgi:hypothetical protein
MRHSFLRRSFRDSSKCIELMLKSAAEVGGSVAWRKPLRGTWFRIGELLARLQSFTTKPTQPNFVSEVRVIAYRLYTVDRKGKLSGPPHIVECKDDAAAMDEARKYVDGHDIEIWRDNKRVGLIASQDRAVDPPAP